MPTTLSEVLDTYIKRGLSEIHTCLPGRIEQYEHETQRASVKPLIKKSYRDGVVQSLPVIVDVPVVWPRSSNASLTFPVNKGDYVLLLFSERSMERFLSLGDDQEPGDKRKFDLTDAIAICGLYPFSEESLSDNNEDVLLIYNDTSLRITEEGDFEIECSSNQNINIEEDSEVNIQGDQTITIEGDSNINIEGDHNISINGNCDISIQGNANITIDGSCTLDSSGAVELTSGGNVSINASNINIVGSVNIDGSLDATGTISTNSSVNASGSITASGDVVGSGVSLSSHTHGGVEPGPGSTGPPQ